MAASWPKRLSIRSKENGTISACSFSRSIKQASARSDFRNGGRDRGGQVVPSSDGDLHRRLARGDCLDEIRVKEKRRMFQHPGSDLRLIGRQAEYHRGWRFLTEGK